MKTTSARPATVARTRAESEAGPFSAAPTKVADGEALRNLIEMSAAQNEPGDDRKTREVDPAEFRALLRQEEQLAPASRAEPAQPATFDDTLDAAFSDPEVGTPVKVETAVESAPERPTAVPPAPRSSVNMLVLVGVALLAIAAVVGVLVVALA